MKKTDLVQIIADTTGSTKVAATKAVEEILEGMTKTLKKGDAVEIAGFGKFVISKRAARMGRNPQTGEAIKIAASKVVRFKPSKTLKDSVK